MADASHKPQAARTSELTITAVVLGVLLSVIMGAANVYLGLKAGMTVSASIPAAVIAMGILQGIFRRQSVLESNLVQTAASAGESLAAGIIFTVPALLLAGLWQDFQYWPTTLIALTGGILGVLLMIPMRRVFVVDDTELKFPEGLACAEVLWAGQGSTQSADGSRAQSGVGLVVWGVALGAVIKFLERFVGLLRSTAEWGARSGQHVFYFGLDVSPALVAVGYIVGLQVAIQIFLGGAIGWLVALPLMAAGSDGAAVDAAYSLWSGQIRYMGVGAMVVGGIVSIWRVRRGLRAAAVDVYQGITRSHAQQDRPHTERNLPAGFLAAATVVCVFSIGALYYWLLDYHLGVTILMTLVMIVMAFFFTAVASYIVGLVGNSNSPVSGMTITVVLVTGALALLLGYSGRDGILAMLGVAGVVCCVACTSGDVCNDLKTGYLVGASPRYQQIVQILGVIAGALVLAPVMTILHEGSLREHADGTGGIGGTDLPAPQAALFAALARGFFGDQPLPQDMLLWGVGIGAVLLVADLLLERSQSGFRLHVMPVAVGLYLPFSLAVPILAGGIVAWLVSRRTANSPAAARRGVLMSSGVIAGESLVGVVLGLLFYLGYQSLGVARQLSRDFAEPATVGTIIDGLSIVALIGVAVWIYRASKKPTAVA